MVQGLSVDTRVKYKRQVSHNVTYDLDELQAQHLRGDGLMRSEQRAKVAEAGVARLDAVVVGQSGHSGQSRHEQRCVERTELLDAGIIVRRLLSV